MQGHAAATRNDRRPWAPLNTSFPTRQLTCWGAGTAGAAQLPCPSVAPMQRIHVPSPGPHLAQAAGGRVAQQLCVAGLEPRPRQVHIVLGQHAPHFPCLVPQRHHPLLVVGRVIAGALGRHASPRGGGPLQRLDCGGRKRGRVGDWSRAATCWGKSPVVGGLLGVVDGPQGPVASGSGHNPLFRAPPCSSPPPPSNWTHGNPLTLRSPLALALSRRCRRASRVARRARRAKRSVHTTPTACSACLMWRRGSPRGAAAGSCGACMGVRGCGRSSASTRRMNMGGQAWESGPRQVGAPPRALRCPATGSCT